MPFGFLKSLFTKPEPVVVRDEYLGELRSDATDCWIGSKHFAPAGADVDFTFQTGEAPPTAEDVAFFKEIEARFPDLWKELRGMLLADMDDLPDGTTMEQVFDSLKVEHIFIHGPREKPVRWEISCTTPHDDHILGIQMSGFENQGFGMDG